MEWKIQSRYMICIFLIGILITSNLVKVTAKEPISSVMPRLMEQAETNTLAETLKIAPTNALRDINTSGKENSNILTSQNNKSKCIE